jgi:multidrug resistance protein, MATE family
MHQAPEQLQYSTQDQSPLAEMLRLAWPTIAQMASYTAMQFLDTWMLARSPAGSDAVTAAANAGIFAFSVISLGVGALLVVNTLVSQSYGQKNYRNCGEYLWQGVWFSILYALPLVPLAIYSTPLFRWLGHERGLAGLESEYFRIVMLSNVFKLISTATGQFLLATDRPNRVLVATVIAMSANAVASYMLIFGKFGAPALGLIGAAWSLNVGVIVEMLVLAIFAVARADASKFAVFDCRLRCNEFRTLVQIGLPAGVQIVADVLAWSMFAGWVVGQFGTVAMAANTYMFRCMSVSFMPVFGLSTAVTALVGRYIGAGRPDIAEDRARLGFQLSVIYVLFCAAAYIFAGKYLLGAFTQDPAVIRLGVTLLYFAAAYQFFDAAYINYNGALRGAGDTFVPAVAMVVLCWGIVVFGAYFFGRAFPQFGPAGSWCVGTLFGISLGSFCYFRWKRGAWRLLHITPENSNVAPVLNTVTAPQ